MRFDAGNLKLFGLDLNQMGRWWVRGLSESLPAGLASVFLKPSPRLQAAVDGQFLHLYRGNGSALREVARLDQDALPMSPDGVLRADALGGTTVKPALFQLELSLPAAQVMRKQISLPREIRNELRDVVGYQVGRLTPFTVDKLYYDAQVLAEDKLGGQMTVEVAAVPKAYADPWIEQVERLTGLTVSRLCVQSADPDPDAAPTLNLFGRARVSTRWWRRLNLNSGLVLCLLLALGVAVVAPLYKQRSLVIERKEQIAALQGEVAGLLDTQQNLEKSLSALKGILDSRAKTPVVSAVIAEMSSVVPDTIYMVDLRILGDTLTMNGYGTEVVDLIALINASPLFEEARFTSPVSRNARTGLDQFTVTARLTMPDNAK